MAAEKYRETQAGGIVRAIITVDAENKQVSGVRAFVHVENTYHPMTVVVRSRDKMQELLQSAISELSAFRKKYGKLSELQPVFSAIDTLST